MEEWRSICIWPVKMTANLNLSADSGFGNSNSNRVKKRGRKEQKTVRLFKCWQEPEEDNLKRALLAHQHSPQASNCSSQHGAWEAKCNDIAVAPCRNRSAESRMVSAVAFREAYDLHKSKCSAKNYQMPSHNSKRIVALNKISFRKIMWRYFNLYSLLLYWNVFQEQGHFSGANWFSSGSSLSTWIVLSRTNPSHKIIK